MVRRSVVTTFLLLLVALVPVQQPGPAAGQSPSPSAGHRRAEPTLTSLYPSSGSVAGGTVVTIKGTHLAAVRKVRFGDVRVPVQWTVSHRLKVVAPPHLAGAVTVRAKADGRWSNIVVFSYASGLAPGPLPGTPPATPGGTPPLLEYVTPTSGPDSGGTTVHLEGFGFTASTQVSFGGTPATSVVVTSLRSLDAVTPAHAAGTVDVVAADAAGASTPTSRTRYTFEAPPKPQPLVRQLTPYRGAQGGGTRVTVTGVGFTGATQVTFGGLPGTDLVVVSDSQLQVTTPAHGRAVLNVRVSNSEHSSYANWQSYFTFDDGPRIEVAPLPRDADSANPWLELRDLACPAAGVCMAVGDYETVAGPSPNLRRGLAEQLVGGDWRPIPLPFPSLGNGSTADVALRSISCPTTTTCIAVGAYYGDVESHPIAYAWNGSTWTTQLLEGPGSPRGSLTDVECVSETSCVALGRRCDAVCEPWSFTMTGTTWTRTTFAPPPGVANIVINDFDCWSATGCVAVGRYRTTEPDYDSTAPLLFRYDGIAWTGTVGVLPADSSPTIPDTALDSVSCTDQGCRAMGRHLIAGDDSVAYLSTITAVGETVVNVQPPPDADLYIYLFDTDIACVTFDSCRAITNYRRSDRGYSAMDVTIVSGTPTVTELPDIWLESLTCPDPAGCAATGALTLAQLGTVRTVTQAPAPLAPGHSDDGPSGENSFSACTGNDLFRVVADSPTTAVALGGCFRGTNDMGVLMTGIPVPTG